MDKETAIFKDNVDAWIKQIRSEFSEFKEVTDIVSENVNNVQHNYELVYELKDQIDALKEEINALKIIQIVSLKSRLEKKH